MDHDYLGFDSSSYSEHNYSLSSDQASSPEPDAIDMLDGEEYTKQILLDNVVNFMRRLKTNPMEDTIKRKTANQLAEECLGITRTTRCRWQRSQQRDSTV